MIIDYSILILYALALVGIAVYTKNRSKSVNDFFLPEKRGLTVG